MDLKTYQKMLRGERVFVPVCDSCSCDVPSSTDPTQDVPVSAIYKGLLNGRPINVCEHPSVYNNLHADELSSLEKRNNDMFDIHREAKSIGKKFSKVAKIASVDDKK